MLKNNTKRDLKFFVYGILFLFLIQTIYNWQEVKTDFINGLNAGAYNTK